MAFKRQQRGGGNGGGGGQNQGTTTTATQATTHATNTASVSSSTSTSTSSSSLPGKYIAAIVVVVIGVSALALWCGLRWRTTRKTRRGEFQSGRGTYEQPSYADGAGTGAWQRGMEQVGLGTSGGGGRRHGDRALRLRELRLGRV